MCAQKEEGVPKRQVFDCSVCFVLGWEWRDPHLSGESLQANVVLGRFWERNEKEGASDCRGKREKDCCSTHRPWVLAAMRTAWSGFVLNIRINACSANVRGTGLCSETRCSILFRSNRERASCVHGTLNFWQLLGAYLWRFCIPSKTSSPTTTAPTMEPNGLARTSMSIMGDAQSRHRCRPACSNRQSASPLPTCSG